MKKISATKIYALAFGLFLGLCIWKFGNPVILDHKISAPETAAEFLSEPWPPHWANWILLPLAILGAAVFIRAKGERGKAKNSSKVVAFIFHLPSSIFTFLPLAWLGWQFVSATQTVDTDLTVATLWQFSGCVACFFLGAFLFNQRSAQNYLLIGILAAFTFCLVRAVDQRLFEFPVNQQALVEGERAGWTNFSPESVAEMKRGNLIFTTNGIDIINPVMLEKFQKARVYGTLVYPNALAGLILLLGPVSLVLVLGAVRNLKPAIRLAAITVTLFLSGSAFFWSGSKLGWLIAVGLAGLLLLRLDWPKKFKLAAVGLVLVGGLGIFTVRFHHYFATGAHSASARLDYWHAAVRTAATHPVFGTGPGTFQRSYAEIKAPASEMARLAHNDWLEQFSDSGIPGGLFYTAWIILALAAAVKNLWPGGSAFGLAILAGLLGWFAQGFGEFGLFIPATAWMAFTLLGSVSFAFDKQAAVG
jgi:O-Antigen ligase